MTIFRFRRDAQRSTPEADVPERVRGADVLLDAIEKSAALPGCSDVVINGKSIWVDTGRGMQQRPFPDGVDSGDIRELAIRLAAQAERRLDVASPIVDAQMPQGWRLHAVLAPVAAPDTLISIRVPRQGGVSLDDGIRQGWHPALVRVIRRAVKARLTLLIAGATGSGKTTLLSAVIDCMGGDERVVCIEEVPEIHVSHPHCVFLHERAANIQGKGAVTLGELVRAAMRMRPDRLVLGECRGPEVRDVLAALNTGHTGGAMTIHANHACDIPARLQALGASAHMSEGEVALQARVAFDVVVYMSRGSDGIRRVSEIAVWDPRAVGTQRGHDNDATMDIRSTDDDTGAGEFRVLTALWVDGEGNLHRGPGAETLEHML